MKKTLVLLLGILLAFKFSLSEENYDDLIEVSIASNVEQIQIGGNFYVLVKLKVGDEWHVYWKNPGDSGLPTHIDWNTPDGVKKSGGLIWQIPKRIEYSGMINYGLEGEVYLLQKFTTDRATKLESIKIKADLSWLVCKEICIPQDESVNIEIAVGNQFKKSSSDMLVNELLASAPKSFESPNSTFEIEDEELSIELKDRPKDMAEVEDIYLITEGVIDNNKPVEIENDRDEVEAEMSVSPYIDSTPAELELLVLYKDKKGKKKSYETIINYK
jgi:thiol:disulfide interchange protein DsbD